MQNRFSLIDEPWIKIIDTNNVIKTIGLRELFQRATEFVDIAGSPTERFSTWRLLLSVAHRAYGSVTEDNWEEIPETLQEQCLQYLNSQYSNFFLLGDRPFLQIFNLECKEINSTDILDPTLSSPSNHVFYDHNGGTRREHDFAWITRKLLATQMFNLCGKKAACNALISDSPYSKGQVPTHSCYLTNTLLTILKGRNILETLHWNMSDDVQTYRAATDKPVWEIDIYDKAERENLKKSFLGRLVPLTRFVKILNERDCYFSGELIYPGIKDGLTDIFETYYETNKGRFKLSLNFERHAWRDLCSILLLRNAQNGGGASCINNIARIDSAYDLSTYSVYCGGFQTVPGQAKSVFEGAWEYPIDVISTSCEFRGAYKNGVAKADFACDCLKAAIKTYHEELGQRTYDTAEEEKQFWNELNQDCILLQHCAKKNDIAEWQTKLTQIRDNIYERSCSQTTTRQKRAFVIGYREFFTNSKKSKK